MGKISRPSPAKLTIGFIFKEPSVYNKAKIILEKRFGGTDFESQTLSFSYTDYYEAEFGRGLKRRFASFKGLIPPEGLPKIKIFTNKVERKLSNGGPRLINIDPGYLNLAKLILASTKDYSHRIYLNNGIFSEVTLSFKNKSFRPLEWTYPDYKTAEYIAIFNQIRQIYAKQIKGK